MFIYIYRFEHITRAIEGKNYIAWVMVDIILFFMIFFCTSFYLLNIKRLSKKLYWVFSILSPFFISMWIVRYDLSIVSSDYIMALFLVLGLIIYPLGVNSKSIEMIYAFWLKQKEKHGDKTLKLVNTNSDMMFYNLYMIFIALIPIISEYIY